MKDIKQHLAEQGERILRGIARQNRHNLWVTYVIRPLFHLSRRVPFPIPLGGDTVAYRGEEFFRFQGKWWSHSHPHPADTLKQALRMEDRFWQGFQSFLSNPER